jgi:hypothetical protein
MPSRQTTTPRSALRAELTKQLVPALRALGFSGPQTISGNGLAHEYKRAGSGGTQILTVQLDKYQRPRFVLNLRVEPAEGFTHIHNNVGTVVSGRLKPSAGTTTRHWFRSDAPLLKRMLGMRTPSASEVVAQSVALLPEVEAWWHTRSASKHISVIPFRFRDHRNRNT